MLNFKLVSAKSDLVSFEQLRDGLSEIFGIRWYQPDDPLDPGAAQLFREVHLHIIENFELLKQIDKIVRGLAKGSGRYEDETIVAQIILEEAEDLALLETLPPDAELPEDSDARNSSFKIVLTDKASGRVFGIPYIEGNTLHDLSMKGITSALARFFNAVFFQPEEAR